MHQKNRWFTFPFFFAFLFFFAFPLFSYADASGQVPVHLVLLHLNDTHGRFLPRDTQEGGSVGGMARLATLVDQIRDANQGSTLLLHAGDIFSMGGPSTIYYGGETNMMVMQAIGYDALTPGNGEFYFGVDNLKRQTALVQFPVLLANVVRKEDGTRLFQPYVIKEVGGIKVAILGLGFVRVNHPSGRLLELQDVIATAKEFVPSLRRQADLIIALTHIGRGQDRRLAMEVPEIDVIVGGHSHTQLDTPMLVPRQDGDGNVVVVQAGDYVRFLGRLDIELQPDESGKYHVVNATGGLLPIDGNIKEDAGISKLLKRYSEPLSEVVYSSQVALANPKTGDNPTGDLVAEALRTEIKADVALLSRGAVQSGIKQGDITIVDVGRIHPWRNRVLSLTLTGIQLRQILAEQDVLTSGCRYRRKTEGTSREIEGLEVGQTPVEPDRAYKVVADEFLVYSSQSLREIPATDTGERVDTLLLKYLRRIGSIEGALSTDRSIILK